MRIGNEGFCATLFWELELNDIFFYRFIVCEDMAVLNGIYIGLKNAGHVHGNILGHLLGYLLVVMWIFIKSNLA